LYNVSSEIAALPASELTAPINRATYPGFARLADDRAALRAEYFAFAGFVAMTALPAVVGIASIAQLVVPIMLGPNWIDGIDIVKICALGGIFQVVQSTNYGIYLAVGKPRTQVVVNLIQLAVLLPTMIVLASLYGTKGAAAAFALSCAAAFPINLCFVLPELKARTREFVNVIWRPAVGAAVMYAALQWLSPPAAAVSAGEQLLLLVESIATGAVLYTLTVFVCWLAGGQPKATETIVASKAHELLNHSIRRLLAR
jgi:O-antigen/teichoic acid export membrane protein